ncbi:MAG: DUF2283 domain-containing protein [Acidobacteriota bacterium]|nr:DUF2283 domain-containing protein [Acidobacteriota bacterium]
MDTRVLIPTSELLELAARRVKLPNGEPLFVNYDAEADCLFIKLSKEKAVISESQSLDVTYDLDKNGNVVGIEILDLYGIYADG